MKIIKIINQKIKKKYKERTELSTATKNYYRSKLLDKIYI